MKRSEKSQRRGAWGSGLLVTLGLLGVAAAEVAVHVSPDVFPWLALAGLVYPISVAGLLLGMAWRLLAGRWLDCIVPLIALAYTYPHAQLLWGGGASADEEGDMRVMTWNVRQFDRYQWLEGAATRDAALDELGRTELDVICLQEMFDDRRRNPFVTVRSVQRAAGLDQIHAAFEDNIDHGGVLGVMTLTRYPILRKVKMEFPEDPGNGAILTDVRVGDDTVRIVNAHLSSLRLEREDYDAVREGPDAESGRRLLGRLNAAWAKRATQVAQLRGAIEASPHPVLLCGDFNDTPVSYALNALRSAGLTDAFAEAGAGFGGTYIGDLPPMRIDYILHSDEFEALRVEEGEAVLSDHRWVQAVVQFAD
jgi:endonuclease/exonuclease/phosphatase family metal-dependent hydrolase